MMSSSTSSWVSEIEEDEWSKSEELFEIKHLESINEETGKGDEDDAIYIGVSSDEESSMDALVWTLNNLLDPFSSSLVYIIHIFPQLHYIPTPLGKLPVSQVNPEQRDKYMIQERGKRRAFLQKFLDICSASKVKVETILIESDMEAKALLDLIPILYMKKLVLGTPKSNIRKLRSRKGNDTLDQMVQNVPDFCELHIVCQGKEVMLDNLTVETPLGTPNNTTAENSNINDIPENVMQDQSKDNGSFSCSCFKPKASA